MKLSEFCTTARRFVDGVCALPNVSSIATREVHRLERDVAASRQWLDAVDENRRLARQLDDALSDREAACANRDEFRRGEESALDRLHEAEQQLAAESEAHEETKGKLGRLERASDEYRTAKIAECMRMQRERDIANEKLRDEEERHAALQSRCYEGFASVSDGIFDALRESEQQLAAEREAHKELSVEYRKLAESNARTSSELSAARADLDALTRWRLQSEEPCPGQTLIVKKDHLGITHIYPCHLQPSSLWRHTPESLAALKQHDAERVWKP